VLARGVDLNIAFMSRSDTFVVCSACLFAWWWRRQCSYLVMTVVCHSCAVEPHSLSGIRRDTRCTSAFQYLQWMYPADQEISQMKVKIVGIVFAYRNHESQGPLFSSSTTQCSVAVYYFKISSNVTLVCAPFIPTYYSLDAFELFFGYAQLIFVWYDRNYGAYRYGKGAALCWMW
jgi:hypothetical protein